MTGHRQEMFTIELTVGEIQEAVERRILEKYKFLLDEEGWECEDLGFHEKNLAAVDLNKVGASGYYTKSVPVAEDAAPLPEKKCGGGCGKCLNSCK